MPLDLFKRDVPTQTENALADAAFKDFSSTVHAPIVVSGATEAAQIAAAAPANAFPIFTWERGKLWVQEDPTDERVQVAGFKPLVEGKASRVAKPATDTALIVNRLSEATPGWTISTDGTKITCPEAGWYNIQANLLVTNPGDQSTPQPDVGKAYVELRVAGQTFRVFADNNSRAFASTMAWLYEGDAIGVVYRHNGPSDRSVWGDILAIQLRGVRS